MTPERWERIKEIFDDVLRYRPEERSRALEKRCGTDESMRREVEVLLASFEDAGSFMAEPVVGEDANDTTRNGGTFTKGQSLEHYQIMDQIGAGGMGVVYRARDSRLNRPVAIKLLSDDVADVAARRRFQREAQMASSLNHPHIVTVYDAGEFEGRQYLVTEFIDGGTLESWLRSNQPSWRQIVELLIGIADGLATAHDAGILHRDIKPANILVATNGYAKLADFGLAKLDDSRASDITQKSESATRPGVVIGTIAYMSPEQASGKALDKRSDVFSFGVTLYEAVAGHKPFKGDTTLELLQAIIHAPPSALPPPVPSALRVIIEKALHKDPAGRYQSMRDMVVDLRRLTRQSDELTPPSRQRASKFLWGAAAITLVLITAIGIVMVRNQQPAVVGSTQYVQLTAFADSATSPALSPDGRMLTFVRGPSTFFGPGQVYVKTLPDGEPLQLTNDDLHKMSPKFSLDGTRIAYSTRATDFVTMDTWIVAVTGGEPRRLLNNAEGLTWVPSVQNRPPLVLFSEMTGLAAQMSIVSSTETRTEPRNVYLPPRGDGMAHRSYLSPDRKWVIVIEMDSRSWLPCRLVPFDGSSPGKLVGPAPAQCTDAGWSPDGKWMYFSAYTDSGTHTWRQRFPGGVPEQVTFGVTSEEGIHFAPDGRSFVTSIGTSQSTVWVHDSRGDSQMTSEAWSFQPSLSPDGRKLYYLVRSGGLRNWISGALWVADLDSGKRQRLFPDFLMQNYNISADGRRVVFVAVEETGHTPVWLASLDGQTPPRRLTTIDSGSAFFGAPGQIVFGSEGDDGVFTYTVKDDGTELRKLISTPLLPFGVSPDGRWVPVMDPQAWGALMVYREGAAAPLRICDGCSPPQGTDPMPPPLSWTPDGRFLYLKFANSTYAIPLKPGQVMPPIPAGGFAAAEAVAALPGVKLVSDQMVYPGPNPSIYAFTKIAVQRNIYRVPVP